MQESNLHSKKSHKTRIVTNVLTAALKLWLKTQVSQVCQLEVEIRASDRQILSGCIPWISVFATHAVYQGLHLTQIQLVAENIRINIGAVLKGQPLRLLEKVPVVGELIQSEEDLNTSVSSALLSTALHDVLVELLPEDYLKFKSITWKKINLAQSQATLFAVLADESEPTHLNISMSPELLSTQELQLSSIQVKSHTGALLEDSHKELYFNLGSDVDIQELTLIPGKLLCRGRINVNP
ncbi:MAG: LmeA family phospholipid-binding protein [Brasilonema sp.]